MRKSLRIATGQNYIIWNETSHKYPTMKSLSINCCYINRTELNLPSTNIRAATENDFVSRTHKWNRILLYQLILGSQVWSGEPQCSYSNGLRASEFFILLLFFFLRAETSLSLSCSLLGGVKCVTNSLERTLQLPVSHLLPLFSSTLSISWW